MILHALCHKQGNAAHSNDAGSFELILLDVLKDMWHSCPKVFAIVVSVLPAVSPLPKTLHER